VFLLDYRLCIILINNSEQIDEPPRGKCNFKLVKCDWFLPNYAWHIVKFTSSWCLKIQQGECKRLYCNFKWNIWEEVYTNLNNQNWGLELYYFWITVLYISLVSNLITHKIENLKDFKNTRAIVVFRVLNIITFVFIKIVQIFATMPVHIYMSETTLWYIFTEYESNRDPNTNKADPVSSMVFRWE
jgi:hypothetical protein